MAKKENETAPVRGAEGCDAQGARHRNLTRRGLVAGVLASGIGYILSPCALAWAEGDPADDDWPEDVCAAGAHRTYWRGNGQVAFDGSSDNGATLQYDRYARAKTPLFCWPFSNWHSVGVGLLGAGVASNVYCGYINSLFAYVDFMPLVKAYSRARWAWGYPYEGADFQKYYQGWHNIGGQDNRYTLYFDVDGAAVAGDPAAAVTCDLNLQNPPAGTSLTIYGETEDSDNLQVRRCDDYIQWHSSDSTWDSLSSAAYKIRFGNSQRTCRFRTVGSYWNFYCNIGGCGGITHPESDKITLEQGDSLEQKTPAIGICVAGGIPNCGIEWAGRIVAICDGGDEGKSLCAGDGNSAAGDGTRLQSWRKGDGWPDAGAKTNRNWYVGLNRYGCESAADWNSANKWKGTMSIVNVMQLNSNAAWCMDQNSENLPPKAYGATALIWGRSGLANQAFWIHTANDRQYIVSDATGLVLEHPNYVDDQWCNAGFHCEGTGTQADFANPNHSWLLKDAVFRSKGACLDLGSKEKATGATVGMTVGIKNETYPFSGAEDTGLRYEGMWVHLDKGARVDHLASSFHIQGLACIQDYGNTSRWKPANNMLGALGVRALEGVKLRLAEKPGSVNGDMDGCICYRFKPLGDNKWTEGWDGWSVGWSGGGDMAGAENAGRRNVAFQAHLTGNLGKHFTLRYRTGNSLGWSGWRDEEAVCIAPQEDYPGHTIASPYIEALAIEVVPRAEPLASAPHPTTGDHPEPSGSMPDSAGPFSASALSYKVAGSDAGRQVVGVARAVLAPSHEPDIFDEPTYIGYVRTSPITSRDGKEVRVHYIWNRKEVYCDSFAVTAATQRYEILPYTQFVTVSSMKNYYYWYVNEAMRQYADKSGDAFYLTVSDGDYYVYGRDQAKPLTVHYILDGEELDCESLVFGQKYTIMNGYLPNNPWGLGFKLDAYEKLDGWYMDEDCTTPMPGDNGTSFTPETEGVYDYYIYAHIERSCCAIKYEFAQGTADFLAAYAPYADAALTTPLDTEDMKPANVKEVLKGTSFTPDWSGVATTAYVARPDGAGAMRMAAKAAVYASKGATASSAPLPTPFTIGDVDELTLYVVWTKPSYDGFDSN